MDRSEWQNQLTIPILLLSTLMIICHYRKHSTDSFTVSLIVHLPDHSSREAIKNTFSFFINKISIIHSFSFSGSCSRVLNLPDARKVLQNLTCTDDEVRQLVLLALCKSSDLNPITTSLVKDCIDILVRLVTSTINSLLFDSSFPSYFKSALY